jgi:hypothetical protein
VLFCGIKYVDFPLICFLHVVDSKHPKAPGARLLPSDTTTQMALTIFGRACISPVSILFPRPWRPRFGLMHLTEKGFTPRQLSANEDSTLPEMYNLGLVRVDVVRLCPHELTLPKMGLI